MEALGVNGISIGIHIVNFLLLLFLLQRFLYKPIMTLLDNRAAQIKESVEAAERMRQESARADQERLEAIREARRQAEEIVTRATQEADRQRAEIIGRAREEAERIVARAEEEANAERQAAMVELRGQVADLAVLAAGRVIGQSLDTSGHRALVEQFLAETNGRSDGASPR